MLGNKLSIYDYIDLLFLKVSKVKRIKVKNENYKDFYNSFFTENEINVFFSGNDMRRIKKQYLLKHTFQSISTKGSKIIEIGCGIGDNLYAIKDLDVKLFGSDYSDESINMAKKILPSEIELKTGDATNLNYESNAFNSVLCIEVLEHIDDYHQAVREINRILQVDGYLVISLPYRHWFPTYYKLMGHFRHYTRESVTFLLENHGFKIIEYLPNHPNWHRIANYLYILARLYAKFINIFSRNKDLSQINVPFTNTNLIKYLHSKIEFIYEKDSQLDYKSLPTSTFILAQKIG